MSDVDIASLTVAMTDDIVDLMSLGGPYIRPRTSSDYWAYATLFSTTCLVATIRGHLAGAIIAFRSQTVPGDVYVQDVMVHPDFRHRGVAGALVGSVHAVAHRWECQRIYLTSEPDNHGADSTWRALGFVNAPGDYAVEGVQVMRDLKGPGKDRAVYELSVRS